VSGGVPALPIVDQKTEWTPARAPSGAEGYRWRVEVEGWGVLLVDLATEQAAATGMAPQELDRRLATALQRYAHTRLEGRAKVLDQLGSWPSPVELHAEHFTAAPGDPRP
jgi:hypothetical protein